MQVDPANRAFQAADYLVRHTRHNLFLTGRAGTGKTTFLRHLRDTCPRKMAVVAPTGVAAINAGGMTIHSLFQIAPSVYPPNDRRLHPGTPSGPDKSNLFTHFRISRERRKLIQELEVLIFDEISMVRADLLDVVDVVLRHFGGRKHLPFGGKQVVFIGDAFQLPPVTTGEDWELLKEHYDSPYFFSARSFQTAKPELVELKKIYRQSDRRFINFLNRVRDDTLESAEIGRLNEELVEAGFDYAAQQYIYLATRNAVVRTKNKVELDRLPTESRTYVARIEGKIEAREMPAPQELELKVDAQVMFVKNDIGEERRYFNGKIGRVTALTDVSVTVSCPPPPGAAPGEDGEPPEEKVIEVECVEWKKVRYYWSSENQAVEEEILGVFRQFPLRLAWAITVHKSQGLTFDRVYADLQGSFAAGQVYVALSRCTALPGLKLATAIHRRDIRTDPRVVQFANGFADDHHVEQLLAIAEFAAEAEQIDFLLECGRPSDALRLLQELRDRYSYLPTELKECEEKIIAAVKLLESGAPDHSL